MTEERLAALEALYEAATPGRRKVVNLNEGDPMEYGALWAVTNDALDAEQDWAVEIRFGGKEDADFDAEIYNALPDLLAEVRRLHMAIGNAVKEIRGGEMPPGQWPNADSFIASAVAQLEYVLDEEVPHD